jgi:hypothetical protein
MSLDFRLYVPGGSRLKVKVKDIVKLLWAEYQAVLCLSAQ